MSGFQHVLPQEVTRWGICHYLDSATNVGFIGGDGKANVTDLSREPAVIREHGG